MVSYFDKMITNDSAVNIDSDLDVSTVLPLENNEPTSTLSSEINTDQEPRTRLSVRTATQELLKYGLLEEAHKPNLYRTVQANFQEIATIFEPLDLIIRMDEIRGLAYTAVRHEIQENQQDEWTHPLIRRQRLNLEQSLLVAILRQHFIAYEQERGTGVNQALIAVDDLIPQLQVYLGDPGSESKERTRVIALLDQLKSHGLVSSLDTYDCVTIRPIIAHLVDPVNLQSLLEWLRKQVTE